MIEKREKSVTLTPGRCSQAQAIFCLLASKRRLGNPVACPGFGKSGKPGRGGQGGQPTKVRMLGAIYLMRLISRADTVSITITDGTAVPPDLVTNIER